MLTRLLTAEGKRIGGEEKASSPLPIPARARAYRVKAGGVEVELDTLDEVAELARKVVALYETKETP